MDIDCTNRLCGSIGRGTAPTSSHSSGSFTNMPQLGTSSCSLVPGPDCPFTTARSRELTSLAQVNFSTDGFAESNRSSTEKNRLRFACTSSLRGVPSREPFCVATAIKWTASKFRIRAGLALGQFRVATISFPVRISNAGKNILAHRRLQFHKQRQRQPLTARRL